MKEFRLGRRAKADLIEIAAYFLECSDTESLAKKFLLEFEETTKLLSNYPRIGRIIARRGKRETRYLLLRRFRNYSIYYEDTENAVRIVRILHGARNVPSLLDEG